MHSNLGINSGANECVRIRTSVCVYKHFSLLITPLPSSPLLSTLSQIVTRVIRRLISKDKVLVRVDDNAQEDDDQVLMVHLNYAAQAD